MAKTTAAQRKYKLQQAQLLYTYDGIIAAGFKVIDGKVVSL